MRNIRGTDKVNSCLSPTLELLVKRIDDESGTILVETAQNRVSLVLVHEKDKYVLRKFNVRGEIAGRVLNNWQLTACARDEYTDRLMHELADKIQKMRGKA